MRKGWGFPPAFLQELILNIAVLVVLLKIPRTRTSAPHMLFRATVDRFHCAPRCVCLRGGFTLAVIDEYPEILNFYIPIR